MHIIYHCYGGAHSSVTAAAIHLELLSTMRLPAPEELMNIPYFEVQVSQNHGIFRFMGTDKYQHKIYVIGRRNLSNHFETLVYGLVELLETEDVVLINTMPVVNWKMVVGGFLSRGLRMPKYGRGIVVNGVQKSFTRFVDLVKTIKSSLSGQRI